MAVETVTELQDLANFGKWHEKINEIIEALATGRVLEQEIADLLRVALEGNQISPWLANPAAPLEYPDPSQEGGTNTETGAFSYDWNFYSRNGIFYIPWTVNTLNAPLNRKKDGICWAASVSAKGPVIQLGTTLEATPVFAIRYGAKGTNAVSWSPWLEWPNRTYLDTNFLNKTTTNAQSVKAATTFQSNVAVNGTLTAKGNASLNALTIFGTSGSRIVLNPSDVRNENIAATGRYCTIEVLPASGTNPSTANNHPLWSMATGTQVPVSQRSQYIEPIWIDKEEGVANINGTAQYANYVVPQNMVSKFKSWEIASTDTWKPATAKAVKDLFDWTRETFMPLSGGVFTGVVRHNQDIFLDYLAGAQENRTAALRSVVRPLNLQCQGSTHIISNSKQANLYLEKEDADSAEFTTEHHDAGFVFRKISLDIGKCREADRNFSILNSNPEQDGFWSCHLSTGLLTVRLNGTWNFNADQGRLDALGVDETLDVHVYYNVVNAINGGAIASNCEHLISYKPGENAFKEGVLDINDRHYQIVFTDTDWEGMPIVKRSTLATGSKLADGTTVAANSVINGIVKPSEYAVFGMEVAYGVKDEEGTTDGLLAKNSFIKKGSLMTVGSVVNGIEIPNTKYAETDISLAVDATLASGFILKSGSVIRENSVLNGFQYTQAETVSGQDIAEESILAPGSKLLLGSLVSTASQLNGVPGQAGFLEVQYGLEPTVPFGELATGSILLEGTVIASGSAVNGTEYSSPSIVAERIFVEGTAQLACGTRIAAGSIIAANSVINGLKWMNAMKASGVDSILPLSEEDIAPIMYFRIYDNIHNQWEGGWTKQSWRSVYPNLEHYDNEVWKNWLLSQLDAMALQEEDRAVIVEDLLKSLANEPRAYGYPVKSNPNSLIENGKYLLDKTSATVPNNVFDLRCYVFSHSMTIGVERLSVQPYRILKDASGARTGLEPVHDPVDIFIDGESVSPSFTGEVFRYFNFIVAPSYGAEYSVNYDTQLVPEQKNINVEVASEVLVFRIYSDTVDSSGIELASFEKTSSTNVAEMFGAPFVYGARTRTGITSEGQLGDTLYDLGGMEISEDAIELKIRKRSLNDLTPISNIHDPVSLVFERKTTGSGTSPWAETMSFRPSETKMVNLGTSDMRFNNVYLSGDPIVSSDKSLKTEVSDIPESLLKRWENVKWVSFKFKDAVAKKGQHARVHSGVVAQDVMAALKGVKLSRWSFFCKDTWDERKNVEWIDIPEQVDEFGVVRKARTEKTEKIVTEAGEQYSIRYQEMQCIENAYLRREINFLKKEIADLKASIEKKQ